MAATVLFVGCASSGSAPVVTSSPAAPHPDVLQVEGHLLQVGGRQVAYIEAFPSPQAPVVGAPVQLNVSSASPAQLSAVVTHVEPRVDGWFEVEADVLQRDTHVATAAPFTGQIILRGR